jgi:peptidoglycan/LPS O-acetylase OafA/YrhL
VGKPDQLHQTNIGVPFRLGHIAGLDGLRGAAILLVLGIHAYLPFFKGGYLGVDLFFAISGFLITCLLLQEFDERGAINLKAFYKRRALRLLPALVVVLALPSAFVLWKGREDPMKVLLTVSAALFYFTNWLVAHYGITSTNFPVSWSLAQEEQFYLIWPITLFFLLRWRVSRVHVAALLAATAVILAVRRAFLWQGEESWLLLYHSPDTRSDAILLGCTLALLVHRRPIPASRLSRLAVALASLAAAGGLAFLVSSFWIRSPFMYQGGFLLAAALACTVLYGVLLPRSLLQRLFSFRPLVWVGRLSYSLYLWHSLTIKTSERFLNEYSVPWGAALVVEFALTFLVAWLSYRFVESPFLRLKGRSASQPSHAPARPGPRGKTEGGPVAEILRGAASFPHSSPTAVPGSLRSVGRVSAEKAEGWLLRPKKAAATPNRKPVP